MAQVRYTRNGEETWAFDRPHVHELMLARGWRKARTRSTTAAPAPDPTPDPEADAPADADTEE